MKLSKRWTVFDCEFGTPVEAKSLEIMDGVATFYNSDRVDSIIVVFKVFDKIFLEEE